MTDRPFPELDPSIIVIPSRPDDRTDALRFTLAFVLGAITVLATVLVLWDRTIGFAPDREPASSSGSNARSIAASPIAAATPTLIPTETSTPLPVIVIVATATQTPITPPPTARPLATHVPMCPANDQTPYPVGADCWYPTYTPEPWPTDTPHPTCPPSNIWNPNHDRDKPCRWYPTPTPALGVSRS